MENAAQAEAAKDTGGAGRSWTLLQVAHGTHLSVSEIHLVLRRVSTARLFNAVERRVNRSALKEFMLHGVKYAFPPVRGAMTRGIPTAYAAPPLDQLFATTSEPPPVWPHPGGTVRGISFSPLYSGAPDAALKDSAFYELLALVDAVRGDARARERAVARRC